MILGVWLPWSLWTSVKDLNLSVCSVFSTGIMFWGINEDVAPVSFHQFFVWSWNKISPLGLKSLCYLTKKIILATHFWYHKENPSMMFVSLRPDFLQMKFVNSPQRLTPALLCVWYRLHRWAPSSWLLCIWWTEKNTKPKTEMSVVVQPSLIENYNINLNSFILHRLLGNCLEF